MPVWAAALLAAAAAAAPAARPLPEAAEREHRLAFDGLSGTNPCTDETLTFRGSLLVKSQTQVTDTETSVTLRGDARQVTATSEKTGTGYSSTDAASAVIRIGPPPARGEGELRLKFRAAGQDSFTARTVLVVDVSQDGETAVELGEIELKCE